MFVNRKVVCAACGRKFVPRFRKGPTRYCYSPDCEAQREKEKRAKDRERKRLQRDK